MLTVKFGKKELNIKFGYEATVKNNIIKKLASLEKQEDGIESVNNILIRFRPLQQRAERSKVKRGLFHA